MPEKPIYDKAKKIHPKLLNTILTKQPFELPNPGIENALESIDPAFIYDAELLNDRLASIPVEGVNPHDLRTIVGQVLDRKNELAFGAGFEGGLRQTLTSSKKKDKPFTSKRARFDNPGNFWVLTSTSGDVLDKATGEITRNTSYGLMPLEQAYADIESEQQRRKVLPQGQNKADIDDAFKGGRLKEGVQVTDNPDAYNIEQVVILPPVIDKYTRRLQSYARKHIKNPEFLDIDKLRASYFKLDEVGAKPTEVLRQIKQEYLGDTTWGTVLSAELMIRAADYAIGLIPLVGPAWDSLQASTGKELPLPLMERFFRHVLRDTNLPLPEGVFDKPSRGRWLEVLDIFIGLAPYIFPPAMLAKIPLSTINEAAIYADKMKNTARYFKPFLEIAESTGTKPQVVDKVQKVSKMPGAVVRDLKEKAKAKRAAAKQLK